MAGRRSIDTLMSPQRDSVMTPVVTGISSQAVEGVDVVRVLIVFLVLSLCACCANAATVSYSDSAPVGYTYWSQALSFPKFDSSLGTLLSVTFRLTGRVDGSVGFESKDAQPAVVETCLSAVIALLSPESSLIVSATPAITFVDSVTAYDGIPDLGGTSGKSRSDLSATKSESAGFAVPADDLSGYIGPGTLDLTATATGCSKGSGAGNLMLFFTTGASAVAEVVYEYTPVPEPSSVMAVSLGALSLAGLIRFRRR